MTFIEKTQTASFWKNVAKVTIPFFIIVAIASLLIGNWRDIFAGDFNTVYEVNFSGEKWKTFWGYKVVFSTLYGIWITNKNTK